MQVPSGERYWFWSRVFRTFFRLNGGLEVVNQQVLQKEGACIVAPVHVSFLDPPAVAAACTVRKLQPMAKEELFENPITGLVMRGVGAFPVRRGENDTEAVRTALAVLELGRALAIFPEGTRGDGRSMLPLEKGVALLAKKSGVPVYPVGIGGTQRLLPAGSKFPRRSKVTVLFGDPLTYAETATGANEKENRDRFLRELGERIRQCTARAGLDLCPPSGRDD